MTACLELQLVEQIVHEASRLIREFTMKNTFSTLCALGALHIGSVTAATIYLAGDSTMAPGGGGSGTDGTLLSSLRSKPY